MTSICANIAQSKSFQRLILVTILIAGITVGIQTYKDFANRYESILTTLDTLVLIIFTLEVLIKITAEGKHPQRYFNNAWNIFDFIIVVACLLGPILPIDSSFLPVLRLIRILRVLRLVTAIPKLQILVSCLIKSLPSMFYVSVLLALLFYVYGTMGVFLYGENDPIHFRNLQISVLSLFRIVTLEDWTDVMYINMYGSENYGYSERDLIKWNPNSSDSPVGGAFFFVSFVLIGTMIVLNLVIGVIMNSMDESNTEMSIQSEMIRRKENPEPIRDGMDDLHKRLEEISGEMQVIKKMLEEKKTKA